MSEHLSKPLFFTLIGLSFVLTVMLYLAGSVLQVLNLPFGLLLSSLLVFAVAGLFFPAALNLAPLAFTGINRGRVQTVAVAVLVGLVNLPLANFLMGLFAQLMEGSEWVEMAKAVSRLFLSADTTTRVILVVAAGVAAPIGEELFFRGWLQTALLQRVRTWVGVLVTACLFSMIHGDPVGFVARLELGVLFGLARVWSTSLWPAIALHATHNLAALMVLFVAPDPMAEIDKPIVIAEILPMAAGSLLLTLGALLLLRRLSAPAAPESVHPMTETQPIFTPLLQPALKIAIATFTVLVLSGATLYLTRNSLPGHELKLPTPTPPEAPALPME